MRRHNNLLIAFGATIGAIVGVLGGVIIAGWLGTIGFTETIWSAAWSAIAGIAGSALAVVGAIVAAQRQIEGLKSESSRRHQMEKYLADSASHTTHSTELSNVLIDLIAFRRKVVEMKFQIDEIVKEKKEYNDGLRIIRRFGLVTSEFIHAEIPSVGTLGIPARKHWVNLRKELLVLDNSIQRMTTRREPNFEELGEIAGWIYSGIEAVLSPMTDELEKRENELAAQGVALQERAKALDIN